MNDLTKKRRGPKIKWGLSYIKALLKTLKDNAIELEVEISDIDLVEEIQQSCIANEEKSDEDHIKSTIIQIKEKHIPIDSKYHKDFLKNKSEFERRSEQESIRIYPEDKIKIHKIMERWSKNSSTNKTQADVFKNLGIKRKNYLNLIKKLKKADSKISGKRVLSNSMLEHKKVPACNRNPGEDDDCLIRVFKSDHKKVEGLCSPYKNPKVTQADVVKHFLETRKCYNALRKDLKQLLEAANYLLEARKNYSALRKNLKQLL